MDAPRERVASPFDLDSTGGSRGTAGTSGLAAAIARGEFLTRMAPRLAYALVVVVLSDFAVLTFAGMVALDESRARIALALPLLVAIMAVQLGYFSRPRARFTPARTYLALVVQACLAYLPMLEYRLFWTAFPGLLAGSALIAAPVAVSIPVFAAVVASMAFLEVDMGRHILSFHYALIYGIVSTVVTALITYGMTRMARLVGEIHAAREELSRMAVAEERLRLARDVHDLLGLSLSAITLKSELTYRLINDHPQRARDELADMLVLARRALGEVRMVASGRRELSLEDEWASAQSVLSAADIDARVRRPDGVVLPAAVATVLATLLREGVTNVLRHSKARWCEISMGVSGSVVEFAMVNDGVNGDVVDEPSAGPSPTAGNGIRNLSHRVGLLGGELTARAEDAGRYRLHATIPLRAAATASPPPSRSG